MNLLLCLRNVSKMQNYFSTPCLTVNHLIAWNLIWILGCYVAGNTLHFGS
ncbi:hypothetical protein B4098_3406 [Heyndrickxia coagulans]|uniref:Uncharacterized protein n=1 Tax=Heyndrickxia coagulans TaxID=1398 RepID=A0A150K597_HEYCO|nr:hypothetical protein B4098_3406 [Heyndrickxia coagulans]